MRSASAVLGGALVTIAGIFYLVLDRTGSWVAVLSLIGALIVVARNVRRRLLG